MTDFQHLIVKCHIGQVFTGDFVECYIEERLTLAKVKHFFMKVGLIL